MSKFHKKFANLVVTRMVKPPPHDVGSGISFPRSVTWESGRF